MKKLYCIRHEDVLTAKAIKGHTFDLLSVGSLWCCVAMSLAERGAYSFPIWDWD